MAKSGSFLLVTWEGGGNVNPIVALGTRLRARGHSVRALGPASLAARFHAGLRARGHSVRALGPASLAARFHAEGIALSPHRARDDGAGVSPIDRPNVTDDERLAYLRGIADDVVAEVRRGPTHALVVDFMQPEALCGAELTGVPTAALLHTLYTRVAMTPFNPMAIMADAARINALRAELGLEPIERLTDLLDRTARVLVNTVVELDRPDKPLAANVRYVGPIVEGAGPDAGWTPPGSADRPLVVVGLGTTPMDEAPLLERVLDALAELPVRVFATVGGHLSPSDVRPPANAVVSPYVRHAAVMSHASVFVTHAGLSGIGAALTFGVPMVCVPLGREQPFNAHHVARGGAGIALTKDATPAELRDAVSSVLADATYRDAVERLQVAISACGNGSTAVDELEQLL